MDHTAIDRMNAIEERHWWFKGRREILNSLIHPLITADTAILEAGCGTGGNLELLSKIGTVDAFEFDDKARAAAAAKSGMDIAFGALPSEIPFKGKYYDLITLFDVLEHIEDERATLENLADRLKPNGKLLVTVPAFQFMWSQHDESHHHFRRYTRTSLTQAADAAGLHIIESHYFNWLLFPLALVTRILKKALGRNTPDDQMPPGWINSTLASIFSLESRTIRKIHAPFGLSLAAVLAKK